MLNITKRIRIYNSTKHTLQYVILLQNAFMYTTPFIFTYFPIHIPDHKNVKTIKKIIKSLFLLNLT